MNLYGFEVILQCISRGYAVPLSKLRPTDRLNEGLAEIDSFTLGHEAERIDELLRNCEEEISDKITLREAVRLIHKTGLSTNKFSG